MLNAGNSYPGNSVGVRVGQGDASQWISAILSAVSDDGASLAIVQQACRALKDLLSVEEATVILLRRNQENELLPSSEDVDTYFEFTNQIISSRCALCIEDFTCEERFSSMIQRVTETNGVLIRNMHGVPLRRKDAKETIFGVIIVANRIVPSTSGFEMDSDAITSPFSSADTALLNQITEATSIALSLASKFREATFRQRANNAIIGLMKKRSDESSLQDIWTTTVNCIRELLHPQLCSIFLCDNANNEVFNVATIAEQDIVGLTLPFGKGIVGTVAATGTALRTDNAYDEPRFFKMVDVYTGMKTKTVLCLPVPGLMLPSRPIAIVQVINKLDGCPFYPEEQEVVASLCNELSLILRRKAVELNNLKHRAMKTYEGENDMLEESILREYGAVTKQYMSETDGVEKRVSFLGFAKVLSSNLSSEISSEQILELTTNHNTDPFLLKEHVMIELAANMISSYGLLEKFNINPTRLRNFIGAVRSKYHPVNAFHNFQHAWGVMHLSFILLRNGAEEFLTEIDIFALLIAAICHDADHPGNNNAFEIAIRSEWALLYADDSVLERHHLAVTHLLLADPNISVMDGLTSEQKVDFRQNITSAILATDMSQHFKIVDDIVRRTSCGVAYSRSDPLSRRALIGHILHAADIGAQTQCRALAQKWTDRLVAEFSCQAAREIEHNIPLTPFLHGLDDELKKNALQVGFISGIVSPLWGALASFLPALETTAIRQLQENKQYYQEQAEKIQLERGIISGSPGK